jgi:diaminohydroxyphosphoribosylaminopyrimidine deaminase/5-amino-6-(5-phosphoribosylamino)uracil reductase
MSSAESYMVRAIELAQSVDLSRDVNPNVGAVVVSDSGEIVGEGFHGGSGTSHAELVALAQAGDRAVGATLYCTLEPCNSQGKTGPCAQAVIAAGIKKVVIASHDPNDKMSGGAATLQAAGIDVEVGILEAKAAGLNASWTFAHQNNRPWVVWKTATTLDGFIAASDGSSKWITGEPARAEVQQIRKSVGAIVTGTGTVVADNPLLTVRELPEEQQPLRVVVGDRELSGDFQIFQGANPAIRMKGDLVAVINNLWRERGIHRVLVEAGPHMSKSLWAAGLVDEVYWFQAPAILGSGQGAIGDIGISELSNALRFSQYQVDRVGLDLLIHFTTR